MAGIPCVAIILPNRSGAVLLQLREDKPGLPYANQWTLPGGRVEAGETPLQAAQRELREETGLALELIAWKVYERRNPGSDLLIEQHVFTGRTELSVDSMVLGEGVALRYFGQAEIPSLKVAYGFESLLNDYFAEGSVSSLNDGEAHDSSLRPE